MILDVDWDHEGGWDAFLEPVRDPETGRESFKKWWCRCQSVVGHLHPLIAEQWIYRHWRETPYGYLPISQLTWRLENWLSADIFDKVYIRPSFGQIHPESDFKWTLENEFKASNLKECEPYKSLATTGTWNYPIIVIHTPDGVRTYRRRIPEVRFCLIEGHTRFRFLKAWQDRAFTKEQHEIFVLNLAP